MKKVSLQILTILSIIVLILSLLKVNVYGEKKFSDLYENSEYYSSIMQLVNEGVISGYSDGTFKPDNNILICEAITIVEKLFGNPENLPEWSKWEELSNTKHIYKTDWNLNSMLFFNNYVGYLDYETAGHLIFASNGVCLLCPEMYGYSSKFTNLSNLKLRGYVVNKSGRDIMSRAEFCDLIVWSMNNINNVPQYSLKSPVQYSLIGYEDIEKKKVAESYVLGAFIQCPNWLLNYYKSKNGYVQIIDYEDCNINEFKEASAIYYHSNVKPIIKLSGANYGVALHELGHFVWFAGNLKLPKDLFYRESASLVSVMNDYYCKTNESEYFAEAFKGYFIYNANMKIKCPETYKFIDNICKELENKYK